MVLGVSTESNRYYLNGIHVFDRDGRRVYEATDGHVCFRAVADIDGDPLESDYILKIQTALKSKAPAQEMILADPDTVVLKSDIKLAVDVIDGTFPTVDNIIPKNREIATLYTAFDPDLTKKLVKFHGELNILNQRPIMEGDNCPAMWEFTEDGVDYMALIMPLKVEKIA